MVVYSSSLQNHFFLSNESGGGARLVLPGGRQHTLGFVVTGQSVNTRFNENQSELGVTILSVALQMLPDGHSFLDEEVKVLGQLGCQTFLLQNAENFAASHETDLSNSVRVPQDDTYEIKEL